MSFGLDMDHSPDDMAYESAALAEQEERATPRPSRQEERSARREAREHQERERADLLLREVYAAEEAVASHDRAIQVWRFKDAPEHLRALSTRGGDESWLALIPAAVMQREGGDVPWMESGGPFGVCTVSEHDLEDGSQVRIGSHA